MVSPRGRRGEVTARCRASVIGRESARGSGGQRQAGASFREVQGAHRWGQQGRQQHAWRSAVGLNKSIRDKQCLGNAGASSYRGVSSGVRKWGQKE